MHAHAISRTLAALAAMLPLGAAAHHAMDNALPATALQGLVSGFAHPVIGVDHLLFVLALGLACRAFGLGAGAIGLFLAAALGGTALHLQGVSLQYGEAWIAASLIALGALLLASRRPAADTVRMRRVAGALLALSGLVHGYAYGESIVGAEATPLAAYLVGYTLAQGAIACGIFALAGKRLRRAAAPGAAAMAGSALSLAGIGYLVSAAL